MKKYLDNLPKDLQGFLSVVCRIASRNNRKIYLVGGFVRDLILGVRNFDLDILVEGDGIKFAELLADQFDARMVSHMRFGTATVMIRHGLKVDIATARKEYYPKPACLPEVSFSQLKDDLARRDFTINAMAISLNKPDFGKLIDFFGGRKDLREKKIKVLHDLSFIDDPTRILRAIRFEKRYDFRIEPKTFVFLKQAVAVGMLEKVQPQRLRDELVLMLKESNPIEPIRRTHKLTGFSFLGKKLSLTKECYQFLHSAQRQINWYKKTYPARRKLDDWLIYLIALIGQFSPGDSEKLCRKYAFRRGEEKRIIGFKKINRKFVKELSRKNINPSSIFVLLEPLSYEVILAVKAKYKDSSLQKNIANFFEVYNGMRVCISGDDLHQLGISPGPYYQKIFSKVLKAKLDGRLASRDEELALIRKLVRGRRR